ncbi:MAG: alpha/beta fold hydrolase [Cyanobacteria bacterium J06560_6]
MGRTRRLLRKRWVKRLWLLFLVGFCLLNAIAFTGVYMLTHFAPPGQFAVGYTRPESAKVPSDMGLSYVTQRIPINQQEWLEAWSIPAQGIEPAGTVMLLPGNRGSKAAQLLAPGRAFHELGYDTFLVDFRGLGGSSGNTTTLGMREADDVAIAASYLQDSGYSPPLIFYGVSMGGVAVLKATAEDRVHPEAMILEAPFYTMLNAVKSRLSAVKAPTFPLANLMVFWGSVQHGFNGFAHNPVDYAHQVSVPTLILQGGQDPWITLEEVEQIAKNLQGEQQLTIFPETGHTLLVTVDKPFWQQAVRQFLLQL